MISKIIVASALALSFSVSAFAADAAIQADKQAIDQACKPDAVTAGCGNEQVGGGLMRCLWAYKNKNKGYQFTPACKQAMMQMHADKKAGK